MSPRKTILREVSRAASGSTRSYIRPAAIPGFAREPEKYQKAVNELLGDRLLEGRKDEEGHMAIALNEHRRADVDKELRPVWARPGAWAALFTAVAVVGILATL